MATLIALDFTARDSSTSVPVADKYQQAGKALVNSYTGATTDSTTTGFAPLVAGEKPIDVTGPTTYQLPDPLTQVDEPSYVRAHSGAGAVLIAMPVNPYDGMQITIKDVDGAAGVHNILVGSLNDQTEDFLSPGSFAAPNTTTSLTAVGNSGTWRYTVLAGGPPNRWSLVGRVV